VLKEDQLTDLLRHTLGDTAPNATVTCQPGVLLVWGTAHKGPLKVPMSVTIVPYVENGEVSVYVRQAKIGSTPLPQDVTMALAMHMKHVLFEQQKKIKGLVLNTVEVRDKEMEFTGHFAAGGPTP
jgi:hypothetical protein